MSTPASLRAMEIAREKAVRRQQRSEDAGLIPLSRYWSPPPRRSPATYYYIMYILKFFLKFFSPFCFQGVYRGRNIDFTADKAGGRQYTSFEGGRRDAEARSPPKPLTPPLVEDVPIDVDTDDYKVDADQVICFSGRQHFLSNLYPVTLTVDGHEYPSVEHYYQACKLYTLGGARLAAQLRIITDAGQVKVYTKKLLRSANVPLEQVEQWKRTQGPVLLHHAIVHKFVQNADLRTKLLETGNALLAHTYERDNIFATGCDKDKMMEKIPNRIVRLDTSQGRNFCRLLQIPTKIDTGTLVYIPLVGEGKNILGCINMKVI
ncbi:unnamed protein product [Gongylonema pulchrum]|uniref:DUF1768 domain-containing protein n=1 Tax=Gongylonema pulchrum TaxID=637853 RepID=A0A183EBG1_9BILA|nr:unnamed protein product [Gongylonema pulchrum]